MKTANLPENAKRLLYREAFKTSTHLNNLRGESIEGVETTRYELILERNQGLLNIYMLGERLEQSKSREEITLN